MKKYLFTAALVSLFISCSKDDTQDTQSESDQRFLSSKNDVSSFKMTIANEEYLAEISNDSIIYRLPSDTDLTKITPRITVSDKATIYPASGVTIDFTYPINYEVTAENGDTRLYRAVISSIGNENSIDQFRFSNIEDAYLQSVFDTDRTDIDSLIVKVPYGTVLTDLISDINFSPNAAISPKSGAAQNYSEPLKYVVTAENGNIREYLAFVKPATLPTLSQVRAPYIDYGNLVSGSKVKLELSEISPIRDSIQVNLKSATENIALSVTDVDFENKEITVEMPETYKNDMFVFEVSIESGNTESSRRFQLQNGTPNFLNVLDYWESPSHHLVSSLLMIGQIIGLKAYIDVSEIDSHQFFLEKDGKLYEMNSVISSSTNEFGEILYAEMPLIDLNDQPAEGSGYNIVIRNNEGDYSFPLVNSLGEDIKMTRVNRPRIDQTGEITVTKTGILNLTGTDLVANHNGPIDRSQVAKTSVISMIPTPYQAFNIQNEELTVTEDATSATYDMSNALTLPSGKYELIFKSNIRKFANIEDQITLNIVLPESEHPTLDITEAKIYTGNSAYFPRQVSIDFNQSIEDIDIKEIVMGLDLEISFRNMLTYPSSILTNTLSEDEYRSVGYNEDGYVLIEDNGQEYKIWFKLSYEN